MKTNRDRLKEIEKKIDALKHETFELYNSMPYGGLSDHFPFGVITNLTLAHSQMYEYNKWLKENF